ncbi:DedA family protein [Paenibacillus daejeonensis]|uniref:DedA family protein n=1 Tax=Paenibacillus daejeonensis TaxID=135193 RepID=UPI0003801DF5|nr:DedA family protein [Paenibacillus daejeonensis]
MELIMTLLSHYGYLLFFIAFCLGPFGIPVPNEVTIVTAGILTSQGILNPWLTIGSILSGMITAVTIGYWFGRLASKHSLFRRLSGHRSYKQAERLFVKRGSILLAFAYLLPVIRYFVPVIAGVSGIPFKRIFCISYPCAILWVVSLFLLSRAYSHEVWIIINHLNETYVGLAALLLLLLLVLRRVFFGKNLPVESRSTYPH